MQPSRQSIPMTIVMIDPRLLSATFIPDSSASQNQQRAPTRDDPFFRHFNRDIRNIIYGYMTFPPVWSEETKDVFGFILSCQQAKQEAGEEGARAAWLYIQNVKDKFNTQRYRGQWRLGRNHPRPKLVHRVWWRAILTSSNHLPGWACCPYFPKSALA